MRFYKWLQVVLLLLPLLFATALFAHAQDTVTVEGRQSAIAEISRGLDDGSADIASARDQLRFIRSESRLAVTQLEANYDDVQAQLASLGAPPELGVTEAKDVSDRRTDLLAESARLSTQLAQAKLNGDDANRLLTGLSDRQRSAFFDEVLKPDKSALRPVLWENAAIGAFAMSRSFLGHIGAWKVTRTEAGVFAIDIVKLIGGLLFSILMFWPVRRWTNSLLSRRLRGRDATETQLYTSVFIRILTRLIPGFVGGCAIIGVLEGIGFITPSATSLVYYVWYFAMITLAADGMAVGLFEPKLPKWRVFPLNDRSATRARWLSVIAVLVVGVGDILLRASFIVEGAEKDINGLLVIESLIIVALILFAVRPTGWTNDPDLSETIPSAPSPRWKGLRRLGGPIAVVTVAALLLGYLNFASFLATRSVLFLGLIVWIWAGRKMVMVGLKAFDKSFMEKRLDAESTGRQAMLFWSGLVVDLFILVMAFPLIALLAGVDTYTVQAGLIDAFVGIKVGNFTLSLADILAAIVTFFVILLVTRFLQRTLDARLFSGKKTDEGFRNSFRTLLGYAGLIVAVFAAIGVIGLDLSNLAIIAGALSVGIGFGLQSIVNNFVSGLILLFERPVKVGDWVVTTSGEGIVKRISVRSTEIETFDRASVIVPNSELISNSVKNWTHKDKGGRVTVSVGVAYGSDVKMIRKLLETIAAEHPKILKYPEPFVYFKEFGNSSLDLDLRFYVRNITEMVIVRNDLRFEIIDAFNEHNVEIPFPQHDVHLKSDS